ncbi:arginine N-succinyltransferase, partial [Aeromonas veronii]
TRPAIKMLHDEGFVNRGYVDIFDAGPAVECELQNIRSVRRSRRLAVQVGDPVGGQNFLICNSRFSQYRACYGNISINP